MSPPHVSIVTIGRDKAGIEKVRKRMNFQTYDVFEVVSSTKERIPVAWNHALSKASGKLCVFTETDAAPIRDDWLERIVADFDLSARRVVHYGEVGRSGHGYNFSNLAVPLDVMNEFSLNESYPIVEDTELFTRMDKAGVQFEKRYDNPVYHHPASERQKRRAFQRGYYQTQCRLTHGQTGPSDEIRQIPLELKNRSAISETIFLPRLIIQQLSSSLKGARSQGLFWLGGIKAGIDHLR